MDEEKVEPQIELSEGMRILKTHIDTAIKAAVEAEREACAKIALSWEEGRNGYRGNATEIAEEIRARGEKA